MNFGVLFFNQSDNGISNIELIFLPVNYREQKNTFLATTCFIHQIISFKFQHTCFYLQLKRQQKYT
jgi:hypothetical protein